MPLFRVRVLRHVTLQADLIVDTGYDAKVDTVALEKKLDAGNTAGHYADSAWSVREISHVVDDYTRITPDVVIATT